ncbi:MAG: RidA family protein [Pigmentiphaga sp.]
MSITRGNPSTLKNMRPNAYSHFVRVDQPKSLVFIAGQLSRNAEGETVGLGDMYAQAKQCFLNVQTCLEAAGATLDDVVSLTIYTTDIRESKKISEARLEFFSHLLPTSTMVEVNQLGEPGLLVEIQAVAALA